MSLYLKLQVMPTVNDEYIKSITDKLYESACEFFSGTSDYFDGAGFAEDGPSLKELTEHAIEQDDGVLEHWHNWMSFDVMDDVVEQSKYAFEESGLWGTQVTSETMESHNEAISILISAIEWEMGENSYEYLVKKYPNFGQYDDVQNVVESFDVYLVDAVNAQDGWREHYINENVWTFTDNDDDYIYCEECNEDTPHFVHDQDKEMQKVGCRHIVCVVCGDGS